jgi:hypothetical protein
VIVDGIKFCIIPSSKSLVTSLLTLLATYYVLDLEWVFRMECSHDTNCIK